MFAVPKVRLFMFCCCTGIDWWCVLCPGGLGVRRRKSSIDGGVWLVFKTCPGFLLFLL